jgi:hypothetical protein
MKRRGTRGPVQRGPLFQHCHVDTELREPQGGGQADRAGTYDDSSSSML